MVSSVCLKNTYLKYYIKLALSNCTMEKTENKNIINMKYNHKIQPSIPKTKTKNSQKRYVIIIIMGYKLFFSFY